MSPHHAHTCTHTHTHTHIHTPAYKCIFPSSHSQKKPLLSSLLKPPSSLSLQHHCPTPAELSLCDPVMSLSPGWGMALHLPTFTSDLRSPHLGPLNGLLGVRHLPHPRRGGFQLSLLTHVGLNLLLPHELPSHFPLASTEDSWGHSPP